MHGHLVTCRAWWGSLVTHRFGRQYQYFQQLVAVYETEPDNFPRLMELMQDVRHRC